MAEIKRYPYTWKQWCRLLDEPDRINDRRDLPRWAAAHQGQRVIVLYKKEQGNYRRRNFEVFLYGTLVGKTDTGYTIRCAVTGGETTIHYRRIQAMASPKESR